MSYVNAQAAFFLVGLWPALVARAHGAACNAVVRALALGFAAAMLAGWLSTQSKGGAVARRRLRRSWSSRRFPARLRLLVPALGGGCARRAAVPRR